MKGKMKMKRMLLTLMVCVLLGAPALAVPSLGWDRGDEGTTYQEWTFDDSDNPALPETDQNPYGTPVADISTTGLPWTFGHAAVYLDRPGVWAAHAAPDDSELYLRVGFGAANKGRLHHRERHSSCAGNKITSRNLPITTLGSFFLIFHNQYSSNK